MLSDLDVGWAAGFFDGEGCVSIHHDKRGSGTKKYLRLTISQIDRRPLDRFAWVVGNGYVNGPYDYKRHNPNANPVYVYAATGMKARRVLALILPLLSEPKREQALNRLKGWMPDAK